MKGTMPAIDYTDIVFASSGGKIIRAAHRGKGVHWEDLKAYITSLPAGAPIGQPSINEADLFAGMSTNQSRFIFRKLPKIWLPAYAAIRLAKRHSIYSLIEALLQYADMENPITTYRCSTCSVECSTEGGIGEVETHHEESHMHDRSEPYCCPVCGLLFYARNKALSHFTACTSSQSSIRTNYIKQIPPFAGAFKFTRSSREGLAGLPTLFVYRETNEHHAYHSIIVNASNEVWFQGLVAMINSTSYANLMHDVTSAAIAVPTSFAGWALQSKRIWIPIEEAKAFAEEFQFAEDLQDVWATYESPCMNRQALTYKCNECGRPVARAVDQLLEHVHYCPAARAKMGVTASKKDRRWLMHLRFCVRSMRIFYDEASAKVHQARLFPDI